MSTEIERFDGAERELRRVFEAFLAEPASDWYDDLKEAMREYQFAAIDAQRATRELRRRRYSQDVSLEELMERGIYSRGL